ncbi:MAG: septation protein IspZ [Pseudomonadota bacterium]
MAVEMEARPPLHPLARLALEVGPILAFVGAYLALRDAQFVIGGTAYGGLLVCVAVFTPIFVASSGAIWGLTGQIARIQLATLAVLVVFSGLSLWLNDPALFKMKPTAIYLGIGVVLGIGLLRGKSLLKHVMEDVLPLKKRGWKLLTRRVTVLCLGAAAANELVWRTQSEEVWVMFETLVMPVLIVLFLVSQIGLFVEHTAIGSTRRRR